MRNATIAAAVAAAATLLSGCTSRLQESRAAYESTNEAGTGSPPMAGLPAAAGELVSVLQTRSDGLLEQKIVLRGDAATGGENFIRVRVDLAPPNPGNADGRLPQPSESVIAQELDDNMPGIAMRLSQAWQRNDFGPFGYAIGHAYGGVTCIYAWQYAPGAAPKLLVDPVADAIAAAMPANPTSVRARLCKSGVGETAMVELVRHLDVYPPGGTQPYVDTTTGPTLTSWNALASADNPRAAYLGHAAAGERLASAQAPTRHKRRHRRRRNAVAVGGGFDGASPPFAALRADVPVPGAGLAPSAGVAAEPNLLIAPLRATLSPPLDAGGGLSGQMPLPAAPAPQKPVASASPAPVAPEPLPLPN